MESFGGVSFFCTADGATKVPTSTTSSTGCGSITEEIVALEVSAPFVYVILIVSVRIPCTPGLVIFSVFSGRVLLLTLSTSKVDYKNVHKFFLLTLSYLTNSFAMSKMFLNVNLDSNHYLILNNHYPLNLNPHQNNHQTSVKSTIIN